jgi:integrase
MEPFVIHDLRRTARSLLSRAGVQSDVAERLLGHVIPGVKGVYDRHSYGEEKAQALEQLADLVSQIIDPPESSIARLEEHRRKRRNER